MLPPCLGRRELLGQVHMELTARRWVTLVGPPGVGKTLVARHTVSGRGGVVWVTVAQIGTVEEIVAACLAGSDRTRHPATPMSSRSNAPSTRAIGSSSSTASTRAAPAG